MPVILTWSTSQMKVQFKGFVLQKGAKPTLQDWCPTFRDDTASTDSASLRKCDRSAHIHKCVRREKAFELQISESRMRFCYECMEWFSSSQWRCHLEGHLQSWQIQHCEVVIYRHTIIRPGYCPFCLWNLDLPAEDRLQYWLRSDNLREHIEGQHMAEIQRSSKNPMCGCSRTFDNERELRHHLHDMHGLNETIWQNQKPPRKRKHACKLEEHCSSAERPKKFGFHPYQPPHNEDQKSPPGNMSAAIPAPVSFVEEHPEQYYCSGTSDKSSTNSTNSTNSRSTSIASCFSAAHSQLSSRPTSPGLDVIDPRILKPIDFEMEDGCQYDDQVPIQLDSINPSVNEPEANNEPFGGIIQPKPPVPSFANSTS